MAADVYCNTTTDLLSECPLIDTYDQQREVSGFVSQTGILYKVFDVGFVSQLFKAGQSLRAAQEVAGDVEADGQWHYDVEEDVLTVASTEDPRTQWNWTAGRMGPALKLQACREASDLLRSYVNRPINRIDPDDSPNGRSFPTAIVKATAIMACAILVTPSKPAEGARLQALCMAEDGKSGWWDRLKSGDIALPDTPTRATAQGGVTIKSRDEESTGDIVATRGTAQIDSDRALITIDTGGSLAYGSASPVRYSVWVKDSTGIQTVQAVVSQVATGGWDVGAWGTQIQFCEGLYTAGDSWIHDMNGDPPRAGERTIGQTVRRVRA